MMDGQDSSKPAQGDEQDWHRHRQLLPAMGRRNGETYAEHLSRVTQDADFARALLQARYRALHDLGDGVAGTTPARDD